MTDYSLWDVILNGDSHIPTRVIDGVVQPVAPTTAEQRLARKNELKAYGKLRTSFRVPSYLNDGNAASLHMFDFTIHDFPLVLQQSGAYHQYGVHLTESQVIRRINTSSDLTRGTCYELGLIVVVAQVYKKSFQL
nr:hypothetical protein [Tanacetum cinerariifolium]